MYPLPAAVPTAAFAQLVNKMHLELVLLPSGEAALRNGRRQRPTLLLRTFVEISKRHLTTTGVVLLMLSEPAIPVITGPGGEGRRGGGAIKNSCRVFVCRRRFLVMALNTRGGSRLKQRLRHFNASTYIRARCTWRHHVPERYVCLVPF